MKSRFLIIILTGMLCLGNVPVEDFTIYMIGDSTMSNKKNPDKNPEFGWGQVLHLFFNEYVTVENHAVNGRSSKSFIGEGRWDKVLGKLEPGDYVFIQFGHNDQKHKDSSRYTNPYSSYRGNLEKYVRETLKKGANPVLFSSIVRRNFNEHGTLIDTHGAYPWVAREVAKEMDIPFIDLQLKTENLICSLGVEGSKEIYLWLEPNENEMYPKGRQDNTHLCKFGAVKVAGLAVEGFIELDLPLVNYLTEY